MDNSIMFKSHMIYSGRILCSKLLLLLIASVLITDPLSSQDISNMYITLAL